MGRIVSAAGLVLALVALGGCGDLTEPTPVVEARVAHAAPGLGTAIVLMDSIPEFELAATQTVFFPLTQRPFLYEFALGADTAGLQVSHEADINGVILLDRDDPTVHYFPLQRVLDRVRILVINGDFITMEPMTVQVEAADTTFEDTVAAGDSFLLEPGPGSFDLRVRGGGGDEFVDLEPLTLVRQDHGFLVILPVPQASPGSAYVRMLF